MAAGRQHLTATSTLTYIRRLIEDGTISGKIGKEVLPALLAGEGGAGAGAVRALVEAKGLVQISDPAALAAIVDGVLAANQKQLQQYREGELAGGAMCTCGAAPTFPNLRHHLAARCSAPHNLLGRPHLTPLDGN